MLASTICIEKFSYHQGISPTHENMRKDEPIEEEHPLVKSQWQEYIVLQRPMAPYFPSNCFSIMVHDGPYSITKLEKSDISHHSTHYQERTQAERILSTY